jgi:peptidoglycan/xylan/chitin deacetylase (PgdA/CDA1 family)
MWTLLKCIRFLRRHVFRRRRCLILAYHSIGERNPHYQDKPEYMTPPDLFERQIQYLRRQGYAFVSLEELLKIRNAPLFDCVALTFDDGYADNYTNALAVLQKYGIPATFFLVASFIGQPNYLSREQIKEMQAAGLAFGCHSLTHAHLGRLDLDSVYREVVVSKKELEDLLGTPVKYFAYPYGSYNEAAIRMLKDAGYAAAVTILDGSCQARTEAFLLKRKQILTRSLPEFAANIEGLFAPLKIILPA